MKKIAIVGAGGHGKVVADVAELCGYEVVFFDDAYPQCREVEHWPVCGSFAELLRRPCDEFVVSVAIGNNAVRVKLGEQLLAAGFELATLIHPQAVISRYAELGYGSVVFAKAVVNPFAQIGRHCIINTAAVVEHDCQLADGVHLSPAAALAGGTQIGERSWLGIGAVTRQLVKIGANTIVGANAAVISDMPADVTCIGIPARVVSDGT